MFDCLGRTRNCFENETQGAAYLVFGLCLQFLSPSRAMNFKEW